MLNQIKKQLFKHRKNRGLNDVLSFLFLVDEETILHKDGALSQHFYYQPPDLASATENELAIQSQTWQQALAFLGDGWMVETNVVTAPYKREKRSRVFPDVVSAIIDDECSLQSEHYFQSTYYLSITWKPSDLIASPLRKFILNVDTPSTHLEKTITDFKSKVGEFTGFLSRSIQLQILHSDELVSFLHSCITGSEHGLISPYQGAFLDTYLSSQDFIGGLSPQMGGQHLKLLVIDDLPSHSYPCILNLLATFPVCYRWSSRFIPLDVLTAQSYLKRYERSWSSKAIGLMGVIRESMGLSAKLNRDAEQTAEAIREASVENSGSRLRYGFYNSVLVLRQASLDELNHFTQEIVNAIQRLNFRVRVESINATEAFLGSIPCHGDYNLRKMLVDTHFISHALPMHQGYSGEEKAPSPYYSEAPALLLAATEGNRPFWFNCHVNDVGHTAILGPTGSGKSTLIARLIAAHRQYEGSRVIVLDKDFSHKITIQALNGNYIDVSDEQSCQLAPLARLSEQDTEAQQVAFQWLSECCVLQGVEMTPERQKTLRDAVMRLSMESPDYKNLKHLSVQDVNLRQALATFSEHYSHLLNGSNNTFDHASLLGFEMGSLMNASLQKNDLRLAVIKAIFNELDVLFRDKRPTLLILEEAWVYLKHSLFLEKLTEWFKTLRKANVAVIFVSQDLSDIANSEAASIIQNSCMTRIYLPNPAAQEPAVKHFYQQLGLNDRQIELIQQAQPKCDYYYNSVQGNRLFHLNLGEVAQAFLCVSHKEDSDAFYRVYSKNKPMWVLEWLEYKGLVEWRHFAASHYFGEGS
ncbi:MAG: hypothetical protein A3F17_09315 [Gammaproteobacteria bacterium RIFCSPHIGHO2_12_FULL_41_15]|nr:MAG: hypothetical protein A3F17_09315 [Gammaproteobacteria bacterium RIFCSPHIGHO2_12_FULL_41_15]